MSDTINTKTVFGTFASNLALQACGVVTGILTARLLTPGGRGELASVILWGTVLLFFGDMGISRALAREVAARPEQEAELASTGVVLALVLGGLTILAGYFLVPHLLPGDKGHLLGLTRFYLLMIPVAQVAGNLLSLDQGRLRWAQFNWLRLTYTLPNLLFILGFWATGFIRVEWFVLALLMNNVIPTALRLFLQRKQILRGPVSLPGSMRIMSLGFPFLLASLSVLAAGQVDKALVVALLPVDAVGCYAAAFTFASVHASLAGALGVTSFVALAHEADAGRQGQILAAIFRQSSLLYLGAGLGVALVAPLLIVPLFGPGFAPAVKPAAVLALATSLAGLCLILKEGLLGMGRPYPGIGVNLLTGAVVALGAWVLVPRWGLLGMAGAVLLGALGQLLVLGAALALLLGLAPDDLWGLRRQEVKILYGRLVSLFLASKDYQ